MGEMEPGAGPAAAAEGGKWRERGEITSAWGCTTPARLTVERLGE